MRADGTPVYGYAERPGRPPITLALRDAHSDWTGQRHAQRHAHDFYALVYVEAGHGCVAVDDRELPLRDGELHAVAPGHVIAADGAHRRSGRVWTLAFSPDAVPALAAVSPLAWPSHRLLALFGADQGATSIVVADAVRARWVGWLTELDEELRDPDRVGAYDAATALLTRLLVEAARLTPAGESRAPLDPLVLRVFAEIESAYRSDASATDIATALGYTPGHLTTVLRRRTGRTLLDWLTERRLTEVRRLLRETDLPLGVIASRTGLGDAGYLVRRFRQRYGVTPGRWRRG